MRESVPFMRSIWFIGVSVVKEWRGRRPAPSDGDSAVWRADAVLSTGLALLGLLIAARTLVESLVVILNQSTGRGGTEKVSG
jgi:hypothetical protein